MNKHTKGVSAALTIVLLLIGAYAGYLYGSTIQSGASPTGQVVSEAPSVSPPSQGNDSEINEPASIESSVDILIPAVDNSGNGVTMTLTVQKRGGYGETLINIDNLIFWSDTQASIRTAKSVAERLTGIETRDINLVYLIRSNNASVVGGPSAGAALTIATIAALENKTINESVVITGAINADGTIGQVGGITEKAAAAKASGATLFLVPEGQSVDTTLVPRRTCRTIAGFNYCSTTYVQTTTDVSETVGIQVREVSTIRDAEKYFFV